MIEHSAKQEILPNLSSTPRCTTPTPPPTITPPTLTPTGSPTPPCKNTPLVVTPPPLGLMLSSMCVTNCRMQATFKACRRYVREIASHVVTNATVFNQDLWKKEFCGQCYTNMQLSSGPSLKQS
ncbi:hypothetical protein L6452_00995 [Arctium lappa]|uniref:Uncharacterized protein n=1 Tax=Arctium lappa TaxID=4217 RepID=A0ACB9FFV9_ARCLA|nr:hypothetical protein L6452_00995 [Arctium lappa]